MPGTVKRVAGKHPTAAEHNALVDAVNSLRPISTPTCRAEWTTMGVKRHAAARVAAGGASSPETYGYKVVAGSEALTAVVLPGRRVVIHISDDLDDEDGQAWSLELADDSTTCLWRRYAYSGGWEDWESGGSYPSEVKTHRTFRVAEIVTEEGAVKSIRQDHLGSMEVYKLKDC